MPGATPQNQPPQYIQDELARIGTPWDPAKYGWDPQSMSLIDNGTGSRYSYANIADPSLGTNVMAGAGYGPSDLGYGGGGTNIGVTQPGFSDTLHFGPGENPYIAFPEGNGIFASSDPNAIAEYRHDARTRNLQGVATIGALVGGGAALSSLGGPAGVTASSQGYTAPTAVGGASATAAPGTFGQAAFLPSGAGTAAGTAAGAATAGGIMNPLVLSSLISGGSSLLGGAIQGRAAGEAADLSREMFQANRELLNPFVQSGYGSNQRLADLLGLTEEGSGELVRPFDAETFEQYKDPGYDFRLRQGEQALRNAASAGSGALSGSALKDLLAYSQDMASTEYGNAFNRYQTQQGNIFARLSDIARLGQSSAAGVGSAGTQAAATGGQAIMNQGSAYGGGVVGAGGAAGDAAMNYWLFNTPQGRAAWGGG